MEDFDSFLCTENFRRWKDAAAMMYMVESNEKCIALVYSTRVRTDSTGRSTTKYAFGPLQKVLPPNKT